ncbi:MAG: hypothetical protein D6739_00740, partial [Nitrospirae bacterium]
PAPSAAGALLGPAPVPAAKGPRAAPAAETQAAPELPRLHDPNLSLQALAWSPDRERRMAVISGEVVREGGSVGGYTVAAIRERGVELERGGRRWLLTYGP